MSGAVKTFFSNNKTVFTLGFTALLISSLGDIMAGVTLGFMTDTLELLPGLMILIPAAIGMRGNIFGALGSRLGTSMHVGTFEISLRKGSILRQNMEASLILTMMVSFLMGFLAKVVSTALGVNSISMQQFIFISVFGGVLAGLVLLVVNVIVANLGFRRNWDIDNISAPLLTAAGDIVTLPMLFLAGILVLNWNGDLAHLFYDIMMVAFFIITVYLIYEALYRRDEETKRIFVQSSPVLVICILLDLGAGLTIEDQISHLVAYPALLVLIPLFLQNCNALGGILTSRMSSLLHMGIMLPGKVPGKVSYENFAIIYIFALWVFTFVSIATHFVCVALGLASPGLLIMITLGLVAGLVTVTVLNFLSYYVAVTTFMFSLDPDDHSIPITSSAIDFIGSLALMAAIVMLGLSI
ncbi:MAG TPA: Mg/Co/Ni transporter MgtE [Methanomassiliicoccales archaeon]|nr:Mg/Co/Ni transporter MgtE [Methanomassiliicoccales archaeon]